MIHFGHRSTRRPDAPALTGHKVGKLDIMFMAGIGGLAFFVYLHTLCAGVYPGTSALAAANAFGVLPFESVSNPLWLIVFRCLAQFPFSNPPQALNAINAFLAALAIAWVYLIVRRVSFMVIRPIPSWRMVPMDAASEADEAADTYFLHLTPDMEKEGNERLGASLGALIAAFALTFSTPFWRAATSLHPYPFDLLLALVAVDQLVRYASTAALGNGVCAVFLFGAMTLEWPVFLLLTPLVAGTVLYYAARREQLTESVLFLMLIGGVSGIAASVIAAAASTSGASPFTPAGFTRSLYRVVVFYFKMLSEGLRRHPGLALAVVPFLTAALSIKACSMLNTLTDLATRWKWRAVCLMFSVLAAINLLNLPTSVWSQSRDLAMLPILPALATAIATGFLFVFWFLTARRTASETEEDYLLSEKGLGSLTLGYALCGLTLIIVLRMPVTNLSDADGRKADFADRCVQEVMSLSSDADCLVTDGMLDLNLRIASKARPSAPTILSLNQAGASGAGARSTRAPGAHAPAPMDAKTFLIGWMRANPSSHKQLSFFCPVTFLQQAGVPTPPNGLCYTGLPPSPPSDVVRETFQRNQSCWHRLQPLLRADTPLYPALLQQREVLRKFASRVANDMGVYLQQAGLNAEADTAFNEAQQFDAQNLAAALNQFGLRICHTNLGTTAAAAAKIFKRMEAQTFFDGFDADCARGGLLFAQDANRVFPALLADVPVGSEPPATVLALAARWFGNERQKPTLRRQSDLPVAVKPGEDASPLAMALQARTAGRNAHSENMLRRIVAEKPGNLEAWALLAEIALSRGVPGDVERKILPAMREAKGSDKSPLPDMVEGSVYLHAKPPCLPRACACFRHALALSPQLDAAAEQLLHTSMGIGDPRQLEADAQCVLSLMPSNTLAHALMGSLKLRQRRFSEAERHLRDSLCCKPTAGASNDLAELYRLQGNLAEAERFAREAIRLDPRLHQAWNTLGCVLSDTGRLGDAESAFQCEAKLYPHSAGGFLALADVWLRQGRRDEALRLTKFIEAKFADLAPDMRRSLLRIQTKQL